MDVLALLPKSWQLQAITIWNIIGEILLEHCWLSEFSNLGFIDNYMMAPIRKQLNVLCYVASNITPIEKQCIFWLITINYYVQIHLTVVSFFFFLCFKVSIYFMLMGRDISIIILQKKDACIDRLLKCANLP